MIKPRRLQAIASDRNGNVYISSNLPERGRILVYRGSSHVRTLLTGDNTVIYALATDGNGTLYALERPKSQRFTGQRTVLVYNAGASVPARIITQGLNPADVGLYIDRANNLYVLANRVGTLVGGTFQSIVEYKPGGSSPIRILTSGLDNPRSIAVDGSGNVYVGNAGKFSSDVGNVVVFAVGSAKPARTVTQGIKYPAALLIDGANNLYVSNEPPFKMGSVTEYAQGGSSPIQSLTGFKPHALAIDDAGILYVGTMKGVLEFDSASLVRKIGEIFADAMVFTSK